MNIFYCPHAALNDYAELDETESYHLTRVLRKHVGHEVLVFDGKGQLYECTITAEGKKQLTIFCHRLYAIQQTSVPLLHIAIAPPKNLERFEWFVEKATEIGIHEITPLLCKHSERKALRTDRIEKVMLSACKQSLKYRLPKLNPVMRFEECTAAINHNTHKFIAWCNEDSIHLKHAYTPGTDAVVLIGPEGDFTKEEVLHAIKMEYQPVSLGNSRLRLETAGLYVTALFNLVNE